MAVFRRTAKPTTPSPPSEPPPEAPAALSSKAQLRRATRTRQRFAVASAALALTSAVMLVLVEVGGTAKRAPVAGWFFLALDLSHIVPASVPNYALLNSIAQTLGLHDEYRVALWGLCEADRGKGVVRCDAPRWLFWFDPVAVLQRELLAGAAVRLPARAAAVLRLVRVASHAMFGCFFAAALLSALLAAALPLAVRSRLWASVPLALLAAANALLAAAAATVATALFVVFRNAVAGVTALHVRARLGAPLFAFAWTAAAAALLAALVQAALCCCCASRRDVATGRKRGAEKAYHLPADAASGERRRWLRFGRRTAPA